MPRTKARKKTQTGPWQVGFPGCPFCRRRGDPVTRLGYLWWGKCRSCKRLYCVEEFVAEELGARGRTGKRSPVIRV